MSEWSPSRLQIEGNLSGEWPSARCAPAIGAEGALGNNADLTSLSGPELPAPSTVKAWQQRSYGREILKKAGIEKRMRWCGSRIARRSDGVSLFARPDRAYGRVSGVCVCGQSLACPVCAPRIAARRAGEVAEAYGRATKLGYESRLLTYTIPHAKGSPLSHEVACLSSAWKQFSGGKRAENRGRDSLGNHVGRELTWGRENGWHYHHHQLRYDAPGTFSEELFEAAWLSALEGVGRKWRGADKHAFRAGVVGDEARAAYCAKLATSVEAQGRAVGSEISSSATKGKNLCTLLQSAIQGDAQARVVWIEGVRFVTARKISSVRWSRGLAGRLGIDREYTDQKLAQEEALPTDVLLGSLNPLQWRGILLWRAEFALCCAANRGRDAVNQMLSGLELGQLDDDAPVVVETPIQGDSAYARI